MSLIESNSFCTLKEYEKLLPNRLHESDIKPNNYYVGCMLLEDDRLFAGEKRRDAAKLLARVVSAESGLLTVMFLDNDMQDRSEGWMEMYDGVAPMVNGVVVVDPYQDRFPIADLFMCDYDDGITSGLNGLTAMLSLPKLELESSSSEQPIC